MGKNRFPCIDSFQVSRNKTRHPSAAMNNVRGPSKFLDCLNRASTKENCPEIIILIPFFMFIVEHILSFKKIFVIEKIDLQPRIGQRGNFYLQREIIIINRYIDTGKPYYLMKAVTAFINNTKTRHDTSYFKARIV